MGMSSYSLVNMFTFKIISLRLPSINIYIKESATQTYVSVITWIKEGNS